VATYGGRGRAFVEQQFDRRLLARQMERVLQKVVRDRRR
jgi:hypothetical protein